MLLFPLLARCRPPWGRAGPSLLTWRQRAPALLTPVPWPVNGIRSGQVHYALLIGAETFSRLVNWSERQTAILFGDGAGAAVLSPVPLRRDDWYCHLGADGSGKDLLFAPRGSYLQMKGREIFKFGVRAVTEELST